MGKRAAGEGTVFKTDTDKGGWSAMLELPPKPNGKRNRKLRRASTESEARRKLKQLQQEYSELGDKAFSKRYLNETLNDYYQKVRVPKDLAADTLYRDRLVTRRATQHFGKKLTREISVAEMDNFLQAFADGDIGSETDPASGQFVSRDYVNRARSFLVNAFKNDMRQSYLKVNTADLSVIPIVMAEPRRKRALTGEEWRTLHTESDGVLRLLIDLSGRHGLRPQELRALRWANINYNRGTISVLNQFDSDDKWVDPKTTKSTRTLRLHPETLKQLEQRKEEQTKERERYAKAWTERDLIITTRLGTAVLQSNLRRSLTEHCQKAGIERITPYELRHTAITHQVDSIGNVTKVADWAGTSEKMIHQHYRHLLQEINELKPVDL